MGRRDMTLEESAHKAFERRNSGLLCFERAGKTKVEGQYTRTDTVVAWADFWAGVQWAITEQGANDAH